MVCGGHGSLRQFGDRGMTDDRSHDHWGVAVTLVDRDRDPPASGRRRAPRPSGRRSSPGRQSAWNSAGMGCAGPGARNSGTRMETLRCGPHRWSDSRHDESQVRLGGLLGLVPVGAVHAREGFALPERDDPKARAPGAGPLPGGRVTLADRQRRRWADPRRATSRCRTPPEPVSNTSPARAVTGRLVVTAGGLCHIVRTACLPQPPALDHRPRHRRPASEGPDAARADGRTRGA